jgi:hypothetical protein
MKNILLISIVFLFHSNCISQSDSILNKKAETMFSKEFGLTIGDMLLYTVSPTRVFHYNGLGYKIIKKLSKTEYYYLYQDNIWHHDGFWYDINFDTLSKSTYHFVERKHEDSLGYYTDAKAYKISHIETSDLVFIDSLIVHANSSQIAVYKFKTEHIVADTNTVCILHFLTRDFGLVTRLSTVMLCHSKIQLNGRIYCPFEDARHFSILNITDRYEIIEKGDEKIKVEKKDWIIRSLRIGNPVNQTILNFYNDTISCNCDFSEVLRGHYEEFNKKPDEGNLTQKQIKKIGRRDIRYYRRQERREKHRRKEEN